MQHQEYLTPEELCQRWRGKVNVKTLANWRSKGEGPPYTKAGGAVLYSVHDIEAYERRRRRSFGLERPSDESHAEVV